MTITLHLPTDVEQNLTALATQKGQRIEAFIYDLLASVSNSAHQAEAASDTATTMPRLVVEGGIHVVDAEPTGNLDEILQLIREERLDQIGALLKK